jgi:pyruvate dehydrogenase E2 component (dihydrolipoamide acetyltransferase)
MARAFVLPDLGEGLVEAQIVKVLVAEGQVIARDAPLLEVETDKATVEIPSPLAGRVARVHVTPGQTVHVGETLVTFDDAAPADAGAGSGTPPTPATTAEVAAAPPTTPPAPGSPPVAGRDDGPVPAAPATRRRARELGVDLRALRGSGPGGRITDADVRAAAGGAPPGPATSPAAATATGVGATRGEPPAVARPLAPTVEVPPLPRFEQWGPVERQPLSHLRRTIAERMTLSATVVPHVSHMDRADITDLDALIARSVEPGRARGVTLTLTAFLLKATALALREHPRFNASLDTATGELVLKRYYHLGVAVATERGLIVPVLRDVDRRPLLDLQRELNALARRTREGKVTLEELRAGTFTITNVGALGGTGALPIINYPEVAILGVARGRLEPVVRDGQIVPRTLLPLTLTFDHRVADGADGARFCADIVRRLEAPERLFLEW